MILLLHQSGMYNIVEDILGYLDVRSLCLAERVSKKWHEIIITTRYWKNLTEKYIRNDSLWHDIIERRECMQHFFQPVVNLHQDSMFYRKLYFSVVKYVNNLQKNWKDGNYIVQNIPHQSETEFKVCCVQHDWHKIICGMEIGTILIWDRNTLMCLKIINGHTDAVQCLQYNADIIISGSKDCTVRIWDVHTGIMLNTLECHSKSVNGLKFIDGLIVTCSDDQTVVIWNMVTPQNIEIRNKLIGHADGVTTVDFDDKFIISGSNDGILKVWATPSGNFVRDLIGHESRVTCIQYHDGILISGSTDFTIRFWGIRNGTCFRVLETCFSHYVRFDNVRMISAGCNGDMKVWDLEVLLSTKPCSSVLYNTAVDFIYIGKQHSFSRVTCIAMDKFSIVSSYEGGNIEIVDFFNP